MGTRGVFHELSRFDCSYNVQNAPLLLTAGESEGARKTQELPNRGTAAIELAVVYFDR